MRRSPSSHACRVVELRQAILQAKEFASKLQGGSAILNALSELEILPFGYDGEPVDGEGWYALLDCGEVRAGQRLYLADTDATVVDDRAIFSLEGRICDAFWSKADSVADVLRDHHTGLLGSDPGDGGGTDDDGARASFYASIHERLQLAGCPVPEPGPSASHLTPTPPAGPPPLDARASATMQGRFELAGCGNGPHSLQDLGLSEPLPSASLLTPTPPAGPPPIAAIVARGTAAAERRLIATFIQKFQLEPTRTHVVLSRLAPQKRSWIMDHFEPIGGEAGVGVTVVDDLACFIRQVEEARTTWGKEIAESFDVAMPPPSEMSMQKESEDETATARKRQSTAAWDELVLRTVRARAYAGADSSSMTNLPDGVDTNEVETVLYDPKSLEEDTEAGDNAGPDRAYTQGRPKPQGAGGKGADKP